MKIDLSHTARAPINFSISKIQTPKFLFYKKRLVNNTNRQFYKSAPNDFGKYRSKVNSVSLI